MELLILEIVKNLCGNVGISSNSVLGGNLDVQKEILKPLSYSSNDSVLNDDEMMVNNSKKRLIKPDSVNDLISFQTLTPDSSSDREFQGLKIPIQFKGENVVNIENIRTNTCLITKNYDKT